jgi:protein-tyrosine phosphatase
MNILMVCLGNICRSPLAEGILRSKLNSQEHFVDSAGTSSFHEGERPDPRTLRTAKKMGIDMSAIVARPFKKEDFQKFDRIYAMDKSNLDHILALAPTEKDKEKVSLLLSMNHPGDFPEVPDPYFGGDEGFETVFRLLDDACEAIAQGLKS